MNMSNKLYNGKIQVFTIDSTKLYSHIYTSSLTQPYHFFQPYHLYHKLINYFDMHHDEINLFNGFKELPNTQTAVKKYTYIPTKLYLKHLTPKSRSNQACLDIFKPSLRTILNCVYFSLPTHSFLLSLSLFVFPEHWTP